MEKVDSLHLLDHPASIQEFMSLLPADCMKDYTKFWRAESEKGTSDLEIVRAFMQAERRHQKDLQYLVGEQAEENNVSSSN